MDLRDPEKRHARRWASRLGLGAAVGVMLGLLLGVIWGAIAYGFGSLAIWLVVVACTLFLGLLGAFIGGLSGLESTDPGREPTQREEPLAEPDHLSGPEHGTGTTRR